MFKIQKIVGSCLLLVSLTWLLAACGTNSIIFPPDTSGDSLVTVQTLDQALNQGNADQALELFSDDAVVVEVNPSPNSVSQTSGYMIIGPYNIPRAYSAAADEKYYRGSDEIYTYLSKLVDQKFQSNGTLYQENEDGVTWISEAINRMQFNASFEEGKIKTLTITLF